MNVNANSGNICYIWIDPTVETNDDNTDLQIKLRENGISFETYKTIEDGQAAIERLNEITRVYLVVSGQFSKILVPRIHDCKQISDIFIFCFKPEDYVDWARQYPKIKKIVNEARALKSLLESHHRLSSNSNIVPSIISDGDHLYTLNDLVIAGELQYIEKTMENIALDIINQFNDNISQKFDEFLDQILRAMMYLLKREHNLKEFVEKIRTEFESREVKEKISQRFLIDMLIRYSNRYLHRRLLTLLGKRNPIPMTQPPLDSTNQEHRFLSDVIHIWDFQTPILLSFGIEKVDGKSKLLNELFLSSFDDSTKDKYFDGTIDLDFGYHFNGQRLINLADVHGRISIDRLKQISSIFSGFLVHVDSKFLSENKDHVAEYLKLLGHNKYIQLIVRDTSPTDESKIKSLESILFADCPSMKITYLPDVSNTQKRGIKEKINKLRDIIFGEVKSYRIIEEQDIRTNLKTMLSDSERTFNEQNEKFLNEIRPVLIDGQNYYYSLYSLFENMSQKRLETFKKDPYKVNFHDGEIFKLHCESYQADCIFAEAQKNYSYQRNKGFETFFTLLRDPKSRLRNLSLLTMELQRKREQPGPNREKLHFYENLSVEVHWRNAFIAYNSINEDKKNIVLDAYYDYILDGNPFEIIDGDNFQMHTNVLKKVFERLPDKRIFVLTVVGPQNSGKSTLLNCLFGTSFEARDGRCTKGMYGTLVDVSRVNSKEKLFTLEYDYILAIDSEGILAAEKSDPEYSKRLFLFCLAVSHLIIINTAGEIDETMTRMIVLCSQSLKYIGVARVKNPAVHLVRNKRDIQNPRDCEDLLNIILKTLKDNNLENIINLGKENIHELGNSFIKMNLSILNNNYTSSSIDETFIVGVQKLGRLFIDESSEIIRDNDERFSVPSKWMEYVGEVFAAIKQHPEIAKFQEIYERQESDKLRTKAKEELKLRFSQGETRRIINDYKLKSIDDIKREFEEKQETTSAEFFQALDRYRETCRITNESYNRLSALFQVMLNNRIRSLMVATILASQRYLFDNMLHEIESKCRAELTRLTLDECPTDKESARKYLDNKLREMMPEITTNSKDLWENAKNIVSYLWITFDIDYLPTVSDLIEYEPFFESLDSSNDQRVSIDDCLNKIREKCVKSTSKLYWIVGEFKNDSLNILPNDFLSPYKYLKIEELKKIHDEIRKNGRKVFVRGSRIICLQHFEERYKDILKEKECFEMLITKMKEIFTSKSLDDYNAEFQLGEAVNNVGKEVVQEFDDELDVFGFRLSNDFRRLIYNCIVISTITYYYVRQKDYFIHSIEEVHAKRNMLIDQFLPLILIETNQDEGHGINIVACLSKHLLVSFEQEIESVIYQNIEERKEKLEKRCIIEELDRYISLKETDDDWIIQYVTNPTKTIHEEFDKNWDIIRRDIVNNSDLIKKKYLEILTNVLELIEKINKRLKEKEGSRKNLVNDLFIIENEQNDETTDLSNKRIAMAQLFYRHLTGQPATEQLKINSRTFKINPGWSSIVSTCEPKEDIQNICLLTQREWDNIQISYPEIFLEAILKLKQKTMNHIETEMKNIIDDKSLSSLNNYKTKLFRCVAQCPCCKRVCDFNHDENTRIGEGENKHRCELGHQIRGISGVYYEMTGEASLLTCDSISDEDVVKINGRKSNWKQFKCNRQDWLFRDKNSEIITNDIHRYTWQRIGKKLCDYYNRNSNIHKMEFVTQNSPIPINHFILVLDHSGSMNGIHMHLSNLNSGASVNLAHSASDEDPEEMAPWKHLLRAVEVFVEIRKQLYSLNDQITAIVFGSRAVREFTREPLNNINIGRLDLPLEKCGGGTNYQAAIESVINVLEEVQRDPKADQLHQTIIFMTDGEPQEYGAAALDRLSTYRKSPATHSNHRSLIHHFWTMGLGNFNKGILEQINSKMDGIFVNIESQNDLAFAYAQIAEIIPTE